MMITGVIITVVSLLFSFAVLAFVFYLVYVKLIKPSRNASRILQTGVSGKAKVLSIAQTGVMINNNPQVLLQLEVTPDHTRRPYQVQTKQILSLVHIPQFQPGAKLLVKVDPNDPQQVAIAGVDASSA